MDVLAEDKPRHASGSRIREQTPGRLVRPPEARANKDDPHERLGHEGHPGDGVRDRLWLLATFVVAGGLTSCPKINTAVRTTKACAEDYVPEDCLGHEVHPGADGRFCFMVRAVSWVR